MTQEIIWDKEYSDPKLISNSEEPQLDFKHFIKWLRKNWKVSLEGLRVLDLGSGTGKNSIYLAERGCMVTGLEISSKALEIANQRAIENNLTNCEFIKASIGEKLSFPDKNFDLILDVVSSNSLNEKERQLYVKEISRVLKLKGCMFVKALCKDGDKNALNLLNNFPGKEKDTYIMPKTKIIERVFSKDDLEKLYVDFNILKLERKSSYTKFEGKSYKRNFWLLYLQKPLNSV